MEMRKKAAEQQKKYDENKEEIEKMQEEIPEWKRGAIVVTDQQAEEEKPGLLKRFSNKVKSKITSTSAAQEFMQSEQYKSVEKMRAEMQEFRNNLKEEIDNTQNPLIRQTRSITDYAFSESNCARAIKEMQKYDREFDLLQLAYEFEEIFKEFFCNFLEGNLEYLEKVCGSAGLAIVKSDIKLRQTEGWRHKYADFLDCGQVNFLGGQVPEKSPPQFTFTIMVQEIDCRVSTKDEFEIK